MRALFISANTEKINMPVLPLGLACVASSTKRAGYDVAMVDLEIERDTSTVIKDALEGFCPDIIGISVRNIDDQRMENPTLLLDPVKEIVTLCRDLSEVPIVLGGAGYSIFPESALSFLGADMGIQGEGEVVFPELIRRIELGVNLLELPGLYLPGRGLQCERMFVKDQDQLPLPDPDLWPVLSKKEEIWLPVQTRRGCSLNCSYCSTGTIEGRTIRRRSPELVVQWIARWRKAGVERFYFVDNTFNLPPSYAKEICRKIVEHDLDMRWQSIIYPKQIDKELVRLMAKSGCEQVALGFESGNEQILRMMNKRFTPTEVREASEILSDFGIRQMGFLLLGSPGETRQSVQESLTFADSLKLDALKITAGVRIYPHTPLAKLAADEGLILSQDPLLSPRFYLAKGLENWLPDTLKEWMVKRTHWMI